MTTTFTTAAALDPAAGAALGAAGRHLRELSPRRYRLDATMASESLPVAVADLAALLASVAGGVDVEVIHAIDRARPE